MKKKYKYGIFYIIGILFNVILNYFIKFFILLPKPNIEYYIFRMKVIQENYSIFELGMPSLFSTLIFYSFGYFYFLYPSSWILIIYTCFLFYTLYLFYINKQFTVFQMFVGFIIGITTSFLSYYFCKKLIKGELTENKKNELMI
jgi:hypothetical protein